MDCSKLENISMSVNGNKVTDMSMLYNSLSPEASMLLKSQLGLNCDDNRQRVSPVEEVKAQVITMSPEAIGNIVRMEIEAYLKEKKEESIVKDIPDYVQRALDQREVSEQIRTASVKSEAEFNNQQKVSSEEVKIRIKETIVPEAGNDIVRKEIEAYLKAKKEESVVKAVPEYVQRALDQREALEQIKNEKMTSGRGKEYTIYESGVALGIIVGCSTKEEVINIMKKYSKISFSLDENTPIYYYSDVSLYVFFDDLDIVQELRFDIDYKGMTSKGLKLGDRIEKAIEIYAQPRMKSPKGAVWDRFAVFCNNDIINSIRIQK